MIIIGAYVPMQLFFAFSYHPLQQQVRFSGQRPGRKLPLAGDYPWGGAGAGGLGGYNRLSLTGPWRTQRALEGHSEALNDSGFRRA